MWESHQITAFQVLGKEKALTVFANAGLVFIWSTGCTACGWLSPMLGCIVRSRPSLTVYIIAHIALGVSRLLATSGDNFWGSVCAGLSMLSCPSLTVYIIACIDLGVLRHHATPCDIVCQLLGFDSRQAGYSTYCLGRLATLCDIACQLSGFDSRQAGFQGLLAGHDEHSATRRTARYPAKAIEHGKDHGQRIDQEYHL